MTNRGFTIRKHLETVVVTLNVPFLLSRERSLLQEEVTESQTVAAVRIHVERVIQ